MNENINKIDYKEITNLINNQLIQTMNQDLTFYKGYSIKVTSELQFVKKAYKDNPKCILVVLKFGSATVNYFQSVLPCTMTILSEANHLFVAQRLLADYVEYFNLVRASEGTIQQIYNTPDFSNHFENETTGFKSLGIVSAAFVISKDANFFDIYNIYGSIKNVDSGVDVKITNIYAFAKNVGYDFDSKEAKSYVVHKTQSGEYAVTWENGGSYVFGSTDPIKVRDEFGVVLYKEEQSGTIQATIELNIEQVPTLTQKFNGNFSLDSQIMYQRNNFSDSISKYGTRTITIATYFMKNIHLFDDALDISIIGDNDAVIPSNLGYGVNTPFILHIEFRNGRKYTGSFRLANFDSSQNIGEIPTSTYVFTN